MVIGSPSGPGGIVKSRYWLTSASRSILPLLDQLHDRSPGEQLRDRARAEQRLVRVDGQLLLDVRVAEAFLQQDLAVLHDHDDAAGDVAAREGVGQEAVEPGFEVFARELRCSRRWYLRGCLRRGRRSGFERSLRNLGLRHGAKQGRREECRERRNDAHA